ncbi:hypothetical protein L916_06962 [Phytophthora nicotianae]|uniref:Uncharacterized protein n=1 Tax=Phytophthora nicotianae TaxID=4792 RepID=W2J6Y7_PHYNI|nr:hypothetical protein L916_06962 [Phytophthora nicotianae]
MMEPRMPALKDTFSRSSNQGCHELGQHTFYSEIIRQVDNFGFGRCNTWIVASSTPTETLNEHVVAATQMHSERMVYFAYKPAT